MQTPVLLQRRSSTEAKWCEIDYFVVISLSHDDVKSHDASIMAATCGQAEWM